MAEYMYEYADGTRGTSPYQKDASGQFIYTPGGSIIEGKFLGTGNGQGGYTPGLNASASMGIFGRGTGAENTKPMAVTNTATGGGSTFGGSSNNTKPTQVGGGEVISTRPTMIGAGNNLGSVFGPGGGGGSPGASIVGYPGPEYVSTRPEQYRGDIGGSPSAYPAGSISSATAGQNPYLQQMGDALVQQNTQNLQRNVLPRVGSAAMAAGGYGGSRQGVVESNAISDLNTANANGLASLYGGAYNTNLQYDLGRRSQDQSYDLGRRNNDLGYFGAANSYNLGMGNLGLGYAGLDRQIANDNASWGQQGYNNNMGLWGQMVNNNNTGINAATGIQNNPMDYWRQFSNQYNSIGQGYGTSTSSGGGGNPIMGALGGAQLGSQVANWWNGGGSGPSTASGFGSGTMSDLAGYGVF